MRKITSRIAVLTAVIILLFAGIVAADMGDIISWPVFTSPSNGVRVLSNGSLRAYPTGTDSSNYLEVVGGNLIVNDDTTPSSTQTLNGADGYIKGFFEVDGIIYADGGMTIGGAVTLTADLSTDSLIKGISAPANSLDFYDSGANIAFTTSSGNDFKITTGAATDLIKFLTGSVIVGAGSPSVAQDGQDLFVSDGFEVDGAARFDGAVTTNSTLVAGGAVTLNSTLAMNGVPTLANNIGLKIGASGGTITWDTTTSLVDYTGNENHTGTVEFDAGVTTDSTLITNGTVTHNSTVAFNGVPTVANNIGLKIGSSGGTITWDTTTSLVDYTGNENHIGTVEFDSTTQFDGAMTANSTIAANGILTMANNIALKLGASTGTIVSDTTSGLVDTTGNWNYAGTVEFDSTTQFDGGSTFNNTVALNGVPTVANNIGLKIGSAGGTITWDTTTSLVDFTGNENHAGTVEFDSAATFDSMVALNNDTTLDDAITFNIGTSGAGMEYNTTDSLVNAYGLWSFGDGLHSESTLGFGADPTSADATIAWSSTSAALEITGATDFNSAVDFEADVDIQANLDLPDNILLRFGDSADATIHWSSTNSALEISATDVNVSGNINAAGGYKCPFFFEYANVDVSWTDSVMYVAGGTTNANREHVMATAGYVLALAVAGNASMTTGSVVFEVCKNGVGTGLTVTLTDSGAYGYSTQAVGADAVAAGDRITIKLTSDSAVSPNTIDYTAHAIVTQ